MKNLRRAGLQAPLASPVCGVPVHIHSVVGAGNAEPQPMAPGTKARPPHPIRALLGLLASSPQSPRCAFMRKAALRVLNIK